MLRLGPARVRGFASRRGAGVATVMHPHAENDAMWVGSLQRNAVLASLALLVSGQLRMLTSRVPRLFSWRAALAKGDRR
jgi:hypothetical protein